MMDHHRSDEAAKRPSDRSFGMVMAAFFLVNGVLPELKGKTLRLWAVVLSAVLALVTVAAQ